MPNSAVLLIDCPTQLLRKVEQIGYDVEAGNLGYATGKKFLPSQLYEKDIFIYNPSKFFRFPDKSYIRSHEIDDKTPEFSLSYLRQRIAAGGVLLVVLKSLCPEFDRVRESYNWVPNIPLLDPTKDNHVNIHPSASTYKALSPLLISGDIKTPAMIKIIPQSNQIKSIFVNRNEDMIGGFYSLGKGLIILLPEYKDCEQMIITFLSRILPKILPESTSVKLVDRFFSIEELKIRDEVKKLDEQRVEVEGALEDSKKQQAEALLRKHQTIKQDETAVLILNYFDLALQQEDVSLFYLYKVTEALERKYGKEKIAIQNLKCAAEWRVINEKSNASYADVRHAPKPGEKVKEWTQNDIEACFEAAEKIIFSYLSTLKY